MERTLQIMNKVFKKSGIILITAIALLMTGCNGKVPAYMPYGDGGTAVTAYKPVNDTENIYDRLMTDNLSVIDSKNKGRLNNDPSFNASAVFVSNESENKAIFSKACFKKLYPASLTKLMTAYVAYKYSPDLNKQFTVTTESVKMPDPYAKVAGLKDGDKVSVHELLNAALVPSANDAAKALAYAVSGSEDEFVKLMNKEALNLGAVGSHFTNSHGLHDKANYTTLYDLYIIFHELLKNDDFVKIIGQSEYTLKYKNYLGNDISKKMNSTNQYLTGLQNVPKGYTIVGGKTGTTDEAGFCMLICTADSNGTGYVAGILKASDSLNLYAQFSTIFENIP